MRIRSLSLLVVAILAACGGAGETGPSTGAMALSFAGLPTGATATVAVTGPGGYSKSFSSATTIDGLATGTYTLKATQVKTASATFEPNNPSQSVEVSKGGTATAFVGFTIVTGSMTVTINGLPASVNGAISVRAPDGTSTTVTQSTTLTQMAPGNYTVSATNASGGGNVYAPNTPSQVVAVFPQPEPAVITFLYTLQLGSLAVNVTGLPNGVNPSVNISGPGGYSNSITAVTSSLLGLQSGAYVVTAANVSSGGVTYVATPAAQTANVTSGNQATITIPYAPQQVAGGLLNLNINAIQLQQVVQSAANDVPMVAGRQALVRVYATANGANAVLPAVRLRAYLNGALQQTFTITAPEAAVPTANAESRLTSSWNVTLPANLVQPGLSLDATVDPGNTITEGDETDNTFPGTTPLAITVKTVPRPQLRLVPVRQSVNNLSGDVSASNLSQFTSFMEQIYPATGVDAAVRATYTTSAAALVSGDDNNAWETILTEVEALRVTDADTRNYYGVVKVTYNSGVAGLGYVSGKSAIGWDYLPTGARVLAHELGHNYGRLHSPCGGPAGIDPQYPYTGAQLGGFGYDGSVLKSPTANTDVMAYCNNQWISDYTYKAIMNRLLGASDVTSAAEPTVTGAAVEPTLLVWGRVVNGAVVLEPSFEVSTRSAMPGARGSYTLHAVGTSGADLYTLSFEPADMGDDVGHGKMFAFAIPLTKFDKTQLAELRVNGPSGQMAKMTVDGTTTGGTLRSASTALASDDPQVAVTRPSAHQAKVTWDATKFPMAMIKDAATGQVLSFARGGTVTLATDASTIDVHASNRVLSKGKRVPLR
ncbi:MAG: hypothetical protein JWO05_2960 [Gemmatimonadetes bacterium]|nr:hypothetical protein [Gemmatimonadota bacterium]